MSDTTPWQADRQHKFKGIGPAQICLHTGVYSVEDHRTRMPKIVHIITALGQGGAERVLSDLVANEGHGPRKHVVISLMDDGHFGAKIRNAGVTLHTLGLHRPVAAPLVLPRLIALLRKERPNAIVTWLYHADLIGTLANALSIRVPVSWNLRCSDIDFSKYSGATALVVRALVPLSRRVSIVGYNSRAGRKAHEALGYAPARWLELPNGFNTSMWALDPELRRQTRSELQLGPEDFAILCAGRADPQKGFETLFEALARAQRHPGAKRLTLFCAGHRTDRLHVPDPLKDQVRLLGLRPDMKALYCGADLVVSASHFGEGIPNVLGEAMACQTPCIGTDVGDTARLIGQTGLIVPPADAPALAEAIHSLAHEPEARRNNRGLKARAHIETAFSTDAAKTAYETLFAQLCPTGLVPS